MTQNKFGSFGFLPSGTMEDEPLILLDFGLEARQKENYDFNNADRDYSGYLFQYTLQGHGSFIWEGRTESLGVGKAFLSSVPENSRYFLPQDEPDNRWEYLYVHFQGDAALPFFRKIRSSFGPCFTLSPDSFPVLLWLNLHRELQEGRQLKSYEGGELVYRFLSGLLRTLESPSLFAEQALPVFFKRLLHPSSFALSTAGRRLFVVHCNSIPSRNLFEKRAFASRLSIFSCLFTRRTLFVPSSRTFHLPTFALAVSSFLQHGDIHLNAEPLLHHLLGRDHAVGILFVQV